MPTQSEFPFGEWIQAATKSVQNLPGRVLGEVEAEAKACAPLSERAIEALSVELTRPIPWIVRQFLQHGSGGFSFRYCWTPAPDLADAVNKALDGNAEPWGGGELCQSTKFATWLKDCRGWAEATWVADFPEDLALWTGSFPILAMGNGDYLALDCRSQAKDPPVVYLSHDDESKLIARSFSQFLVHWERVAYVGPESWMIEGFLDADGFLDGDTDKAQAWRAIFGTSA